MPAEFDLGRIVHHERDLISGYHLMMGRGWRIIGEQEKLHSPLAYSAFEFRCSIERVLIELFVLVKDKKVTRDDLKNLNSVSNVRKAIHRACGGKKEFERTQIFNRLYSQGGNSPPEIWISRIDVELLERNWSLLSEYCHRQLEPYKTWKSMGNQWLNDGYKLLNEVEGYLWSILVSSHIGWVQPSTMQPEMLEALKDFVSGKITQSILETRMTIMGPIIHKRVRGRY
jgi:hypothetical protein